MFSNLFFALKTITAQASQHPTMASGSLETVSSGVSASAQYRSAVNVPTRNVPSTDMMHHQGMYITVTMLAVAQCSIFCGIYM